MIEIGIFQEIYLRFKEMFYHYWKWYKETQKGTHIILLNKSNILFKLKIYRITEYVKFHGWYNKLFMSSFTIQGTTWFTSSA